MTSSASSSQRNTGGVVTSSPAAPRPSPCSKIGATRAGSRGAGRRAAPPAFLPFRTDGFSCALPALHPGRVTPAAAARNKVSAAAAQEHGRRGEGGRRGGRSGWRRAVRRAEGGGGAGRSRGFGFTAMLLHSASRPRVCSRGRSSGPVSP